MTSNAGMSDSLSGDQEGDSGGQLIEDDGASNKIEINSGMRHLQGQSFFSPGLHPSH